MQRAVEQKHRDVVGTQDESAPIELVGFDSLARQRREERGDRLAPLVQKAPAKALDRKLVLRHRKNQESLRNSETVSGDSSACPRCSPCESTRRALRALPSAVQPSAPRKKRM